MFKKPYTNDKTRIIRESSRVIFEKNNNKYRNNTKVQAEIMHTKSTVNKVINKQHRFISHCQNYYISNQECNQRRNAHFVCVPRLFAVSSRKVRFAH